MCSGIPTHKLPAPKKQEAQQEVQKCKKVFSLDLRCLLGRIRPHLEVGLGALNSNPMFYIQRCFQPMIFKLYTK